MKEQEYQREHWQPCTTTSGRPVIAFARVVSDDPIPADHAKDLPDQLEGCLIASRDYAKGIAYGNSIPSGFGDAFKEVLRCRQSLDAAIEESK